jgi:hypothetical protein
MSAPDDKQDGTPQNILEPPFDQALHLRLKPYAEFKEKMSPLFARISSEERERFLRDIYRLAAKKVLMETARADAENLAQSMAGAAEMIQSATPHMEAASQNLLKAADALPPESPGRKELDGIIERFQDFQRGLTDQGQQLARFAGKLRNLEGKDISLRSDTPSSLLYAFPLEKMDEVATDLPSGEQSLDNYIRSLAGPAATAPYRFHIPSGRKLTATDHWLISAIYKYLPGPPPGKRSRFDRDEVICMTFEAALGDPMRTIEGVKSTRRRKTNS